MMKYILPVLVFINVFPVIIQAQSLVLNGNVNCYHNNNSRQSRGAESVIVTEEGGIKTYTASNTGYYHLDLQKDYRQFLYKNIRVFFITRTQAYSASKIVLITPDKLKHDSQDPNLVYYSVGKKSFSNGCNDIEIPSARLMAYMDSLNEKSDDDYEANDGYTSIATLLQNFMLFPAAAAGPPDSVITYYNPIVYTEKSQIKNTILFKDAPFLLSGNTGFNFAPARDMSESVFWNAAAMTSTGKSLASAYTNLTNYARVSGLFQLSKKTVLGFGAATLRQSQMRAVLLDSTTRDHKFTSGGSSLQLSLGRKLSKTFSLGASVKYMKQGITYPSKIEVTETYRNGEWRSTSYDIITDKIDTSTYNVDVSMHWRVLRFLSLGLNLGNLLNKPIIQETSDSVLAFEAINARYAGLGINFEHDRWNAGVDLQYSASGFIIGLGASYTFSNDFRINTSYVPQWKALAIQLKFKHFSIAYMDNFVISETFPKTIFNRRRLYSGFLGPFD